MRVHLLLNLGIKQILAAQVLQVTAGCLSGPECSSPAPVRCVHSGRRGSGLWGWEWTDPGAEWTAAGPEAYARPLPCAGHVCGKQSPRLLPHAHGDVQGLPSGLRVWVLAVSLTWSGQSVHLEKTLMSLNFAPVSKKTYNFRKMRFNFPYNFAKCFF